MKSSNLAKKGLLAVTISALIGTCLLAKTIDVTKAKKDIRVMTRIIEASLEASANSFPGRPRIDATYLATQGYLFTIQLNGLSSFGIPGIASWDRGRLELNVPELLNEIFTSQEFIAPLAQLPESIASSFDGLYDDDELQEDLRVLREKQRDLRKESYKIRREIRKIDDDEKLQELEELLDENRNSLQKSNELYAESLDSYRKKRNVQRIKKSNDAINAIFSTICDYGQSLKALKKNEKVTLMIKGGLNADGVKATQLYVIEQSSLKECDDSLKLKKSALHYSL